MWSGDYNHTSRVVRGSLIWLLALAAASAGRRRAVQPNRIWAFNRPPAQFLAICMQHTNIRGASAHAPSTANIQSQCQHPTLSSTDSIAALACWHDLLAMDDGKSSCCLTKSAVGNPTLGVPAGFA